MKTMTEERKGRKMSIASRCIQPKVEQCSFPATQTDGWNKKKDIRRLIVRK